MLVEIDGTEFSVHEDYATEVGTVLRYDPKTGTGYIPSDGQRLSMCSYGMFGDDLYRARLLADRWLDKARTAWEEAQCAM